jgi:hypothetical protein
VQGSPYNYVREIFAAIDHHLDGFPAPFNAEIIPTLVRLYEFYVPNGRQLYNDF